MNNEMNKGVDAFARLDGTKACVDIGGTKVAVSMADRKGIRGRVTESTVKEGTSDALGQQIIRLIGQVHAFKRELKFVVPFVRH